MNKEVVTIKIKPKYNGVMEIEKFSKDIFEYCKLEIEKPLVLALSGGADSLCLYDLLKKLGFQLFVVHLDHQLRPESGEDAEFVKNITMRDGYPFVLGCEDVRDFAHKNKLGIEDAARQVRYQFLFQQARKLKAQAVVTAHTADDQVETVLMHLLRGSGIFGLKGMISLQQQTEWDPEIPLVRPLLEVWRHEVLDYCHQRNLIPVQDQSNFDSSYFRNRVRQELIPYLKEYNPQVKKAIWRMAKMLEGDSKIILTAIESSWQKTCKRKIEDSIQFDFTAFRGSDCSIQRHLLHRALCLVGGSRTEISFEVVDRALGFLLQPKNKRKLSLVGGISILIENQELIITRNEPQKDLSEYPQIEGKIKLSPPCDWEVGAHWQFTAREFDYDHQSNLIDTFDSFKAFMDVKKINYPLSLRGRLPGDRFKPYGLKGHTVKISDFFINERIPKEARSAYPLLCSELNIIWIPGFRIAHGFEVTDSTQRVLQVQIRKI